MNSIDREQPESNRENLSGQAAIERIREMAEGNTCFFCTLSRKTTAEFGAIHSRPMSVLQVDEQGCLWFLSANDSIKNQELQNDSEVRLYLQGSAHSDFLELHGHASISTDPARIDELWKPLAKTWFTEGKDDPRITVIKVTPTDGYYWDTKHNQAIAGVKMLIGAALGKTLDDSVQGTLAPNLAARGTRTPERPRSTPR